MVNFDPGPIGTVYDQRVENPLADFNGQALDGSSISLDIQLPPGVALELVWDGTGGGTTGVNASVTFDVTSSPSLPSNPFGSILFVPGTGPLIFDEETGPGFVFNDDQFGVVYFAAAMDGLQITGGTLSFDLPNDPGVTITGGTARFGIGSSDTFDFRVVQVVPEPSSLALLGLGGLMVGRRRRQRQSLYIFRSL
ncbi:PEP-CTERM motif protein [Botrimarina hoheduenensis]|uniref:PEP-CTERM motif protein n=2 Tax=Botrimarina hoheduenensis TaxID=2528000 RepID=A0A5C5W7G8_9BACT|nr:PEP-CTERM motif protein [Botrimarina hoheduenensis]